MVSHNDLWGYIMEYQPLSLLLRHSLVPNQTLFCSVIGWPAFHYFKCSGSRVHPACRVLQQQHFQPALLSFFVSSTVKVPASKCSVLVA